MYTSIWESAAALQQRASCPSLSQKWRKGKRHTENKLQTGKCNSDSINNHINVNKHSELKTKVGRPYFKKKDPYQCQLYKVEERKKGREKERKEGRNGKREKKIGGKKVKESNFK